MEPGGRVYTGPRRIPLNFGPDPQHTHEQAIKADPITHCLFFYNVILARELSFL